MKKSILLATIIVYAICFNACNYKTDISKEDEKYYLTEPKRVYQGWFDDFQKKHPNFMDEKNGFDTLKISFQNEMISNPDFYKSLMNAFSPIELDILWEKPHTLTSATLGKYEDSTKNEIGESKVFLIYAKVKLLEPMYNGQDEIDLYYEITSCIPSTEKNHDKPYIANSDTCILAKSIYFNDRKCSSKILGSFIIK